MLAMVEMEDGMKERSVVVFVVVVSSVPRGDERRW